MKTALLFSEESKCAAKKVACLLVKNKAIISVGINGSAPGATNCCDKFKKVNGVWCRILDKSGHVAVCKDQEEHHKWSLLYETHAEINALGKTNQLGISTKGAVAYITHSPCHDCAKALATAGIETIVYLEEFDNLEEVAKALGQYGIAIYKLEV